MEPTEKSYTYQSPYMGIEGYHSNKFLDLADQKFKSGISTSKGATLFHVSAPFINIEGASELKDCNIGRMQSKGQICMLDCLINSVVTSDCLQASHSSIGSIDSGSNVQLYQVSDLTSLSTGGQVNAAQSSIDNIHSDSQVNLANCYTKTIMALKEVNFSASTGNYLYSKSNVRLNTATVNKVECDQMEAENARVGIVQAKKNVNLRHCDVIVSLEADDLVCSKCNVLGTLKIISNALLTECPSVADIVAKRVMLNSCHVEGSVEAANVIINSSKIQGTLITADRTCKLVDSYVKTLHLKKPPIECMQRNIQNVDPELKSQTVIIFGGHVEEIYFEQAGGLVRCENGGRFGKITYGLHMEEKEPPENFIDDIQMTIMQNPYRLPEKPYRVLDYTTLDLLINKNTKTFTCPFSRNIYHLDQCTPDLELKKAIESWLKLYIPK